MHNTEYWQYGLLSSNSRARRGKAGNTAWDELVEACLTQS